MADDAETTQNQPGRVILKTARNLAFCYLGAALAISALLCLFRFGSRCQLYLFQFKASRRVNPVELQQWATNLLKQFPNGYNDPKGTNLPSEVAHIRTHRPSAIAGTMNEEAAVLLFWGRGEPALVVGSPRFVSTNSGAKMWKPGIYFLKPVE
jgi:hypothetical protein